MRRIFTGDGFGRQLMLWSLRGIFCAGPSYYWALVMDFRHPAEQLAMLAGVATYVLVFSWVDTRLRSGAWADARDLAWSLRMGASLRAIVAPLMVFGPDVWCGFVALSVVERAASFFGVLDVPLANSFGWTCGATLLQGGLISVTMLGLAVGLWGARFGWRWLRRINQVAMAR